MRTIKLISSALILTAIVALPACKGKEEVSKKEGGFKEIDIPCSGPKFTSDKNFFRADNSAKSNDMSLSREKALTLTKQRLASLIETQVKSVTDRYVNEREFGEGSEFEGKFENMTREVVNLKLNDIKIICEKTGSLGNGQYQTFVAVEIDKESLLNGLNAGISKDQKLQVDYDKMKYEQIFNEEMEKLANEK
ncbi:MAG: hypothetical protein RIC15_03965 [Vicingaceae bacterium]